MLYHKIMLVRSYLLALRSSNHPHHASALLSGVKCKETFSTQCTNHSYRYQPTRIHGIMSDTLAYHNQGYRAISCLRYPLLPSSSICSYHSVPSRRSKSLTEGIRFNSGYGNGRPLCSSKGRQIPKSSTPSSLSKASSPNPSPISCLLGLFSG